PGRVELTGMVDLATRSITAAVLRPTTKSVDASLLLARTVTPEPMRPGWAQALAMSRSGLPHRRPPGLGGRLGPRPARPVDRAGDDRVRPGKRVHLAQLPRRLRQPGHQLPAGPPAHPDRQAAHRADPGIGEHAVLPVRLRLSRPQRRAPRPAGGGRTVVVAARASGTVG